MARLRHAGAFFPLRQWCSKLIKVSNVSVVYLGCVWYPVPTQKIPSQHRIWKIHVFVSMGQCILAMPTSYQKFSSPKPGCEVHIEIHNPAGLTLSRKWRNHRPHAPPDSHPHEKVGPLYKTGMRHAHLRTNCTKQHLI
jgi:hypothetical protein